MKQPLVYTAFALISLAGAMALATPQSSNNTQEQKMEVTKQTELFEGPADYFTGHVTVGTIFNPEHNGYSGALVNFDPGARTAWHVHPKGQTLVVVSGEGRAQSQGEPVQVIKPGDVVWIPAGERHWHGAAPNTAMSHVAIQSPDDKGDVVTWMEQVSDEQYLAK